MTTYSINVSLIPPYLHRLVFAWYTWRVVGLRGSGEFPGTSTRVPEPWETTADVFWGRRVPIMGTPQELAVIDAVDLSLYIGSEGEGIYVDQEIRGTRRRKAVFRDVQDAEKYLLLLFSQTERPGSYNQSPDYLWYQNGLAPSVQIRPVDPELEYPQTFYYCVDGHDRGWMSESDAVSFSHAVLLSYEELESELKKGIPPEWFDFTLVEA